MEKKEFVLFKKEKGNHMQTGHDSLILRFHGLLLIPFLRRDLKQTSRAHRKPLAFCQNKFLIFRYLPPGNP